MLFALTLSVDKNVIEIYYYKDVEFLGQDLIDIILKRGQCVGQSERHDLILKMTIGGLKGRLPFIAFLDPHSMVSIGQIKLGESSSPT